MICHRCTNQLRLALRSHQTRLLTTTPQNPKPSSPAPATSTSAAQPFSTPYTPSPSKTPLPTSSKTPTQPPPPKSSVPAGTPLRGLNYLRNAEAPVAKEDHEYPPWLWTLLSPSSTASTGKGNTDEAMGDAFAKSKKQRRLASKAARARLTGEGGEMVREVKLYEQSVDLASGMEGGAQKRGGEERGALRKAMRGARKRKIKEGNFLRGMR